MKPKEVGFELLEHRAGNFRVWDWPLEGRKYVIGVDVSEGVVRDKSTLNKRASALLSGRKEDRPDFSAAIVLDLESGEHVATWHGYQEPFDFAHSLAAIGALYHDALLAVEINGPGYAVLQMLVRDIKYPNLYRSTYYGQTRQIDGELEYGWRTNSMLMSVLVARVHALRTAGWTSRDATLVKEIGHVQYDDRGTPRSKGRDKDDTVFALAIALQARHESLTGTIAPPPEPPQAGPDDWIRDHIKARRARLRPHGYRSILEPRADGAGAF